MPYRIASIRTPTSQVWFLASLADIASKVCQGLASPKGYARFLRITMVSLSQAPRLGSLLLPHGAFEDTFLTVRGGPHRLCPKAHRVPVHPMVLRHSSLPFHGTV